MNQEKISGMKKSAAIFAVKFIRSGMSVGLGSGSTALFAIEEIAHRLNKGEISDLFCIPSSEETKRNALSMNIKVYGFDKVKRLDINIDGADEVDKKGNLIKGGGGALLREKIVANSATQMVVIADETKLVHKLGAFDLPVEVIPFGHRTIASRIVSASEQLGYLNLVPKLRMQDGAPFKTDNSNYIYDYPYGAIADAKTLADTLSCITGVAEHGLFVDIATSLIIAGAHGVSVTNRSFDKA